MINELTSATLFALVFFRFSDQGHWSFLVFML